MDEYEPVHVLWVPYRDLHFGDRGGRETAQFLPRRHRPRVLRSSHHSLRRLGVQTPTEHRRYAPRPHAPHAATASASGYSKPSVIPPLCGITTRSGITTHPTPSLPSSSFAVRSFVFLCTLCTTGRATTCVNYPSCTLTTRVNVGVSGCGLVISYFGSRKA